MIATLHQLYIHQIKDLHSAECQVLEPLTQMASKACCDELKAALTKHADETRTHLTRLETILRNHNETPGDVECEAAKGIIKEGQHLLSELRGDAIDPGIIAACQRFEHYEIAAYGTVKEYAKALDLDGDADLLDENLDEESDANEKLTKIATGGFFRSGVNEEATPS